MGFQIQRPAREGETGAVAPEIRSRNPPMAWEDGGDGLHAMTVPTFPAPPGRPTMAAALQGGHCPRKGAPTAVP